MGSCKTVKTATIFNKELGRVFDLRLEKIIEGEVTMYAWFGEQPDGSFVSCEVSAETKKQAIADAHSSWGGDWDLRIEN